MARGNSTLLPDLLCDFPLTSEIFALAAHPTQPVVSIGLARGHVTTIRLPPSDEWPESRPNSRSDLPAVDPVSTSNPTTKTKKKRVSISNKILTATPSSDLAALPPSRIKNICRPTNLVHIEWQTRRHKVSCRDLSFSTDGEVLFSGGGDSILKASNAETGKVITKILLPPPERSSSKADVPVVLRTLSPQTLLIGTESTALHVLDLRAPPVGKANSSSKSGSTTVFDCLRLEASYYPHPSDFISSISLVPATSASTSGFSKQWISSGGGTLALTDLRKGVIFQSENHCQDFLSTLVINPGNGSGSEKVLAASDFSNSVSIFSKANLDLEVGKLRCVDENESIDAMTIAPSSFQAVQSDGDGDVVACATSSGYVRLVGTNTQARRRNRLTAGDHIIASFPHAELESVNAVAFDVHGRMIVGGGQTVRVWSEQFHSASRTGRSDRTRFEDANSSEAEVWSDPSDGHARSGVALAESTISPDLSNDEPGHSVSRSVNGQVLPHAKRKKASSKLQLSDAWKFNFQSDRTVETIEQQRTIDAGASDPANDGSLQPAMSSTVDDTSGSDSDDFSTSRQARKKKKLTSNLPSRGAAISFLGLD